MNSQLIDFDRILLILFAALLLRVSWRLYSPRLRRRWRRAKARLPRRWKPRSPKDCPHCCQGLSLESRPLQREVEPYSKRKSTRGRKQEIPSAGYACLNPHCEYFGITDDQVHALVGNGKRGIKQNIQHKTPESDVLGLTPAEAGVLNREGIGVLATLESSAPTYIVNSTKAIGLPAAA